MSLRDFNRHAFAIPCRHRAAGNGAGLQFFHTDQPEERDTQQHAQDRRRGGGCADGGRGRLSGFMPIRVHLQPKPVVADNSLPSQPAARRPPQPAAAMARRCEHAG